MTSLRFRIVGTGFIAGAVADSIESASRTKLVAVSSRQQAKADAFVANRHRVEGLGALLGREDIEAGFIATRTATKEAITLAAIKAGKHVLVDKPLPDAAAVIRMVEAATNNGLVFMDGTHFVHDPRTQAIKTYRSDMATRKEFSFIETPSEIAGDVLMIDHFAALVQPGNDEKGQAYRSAALITQTYLDGVWGAVMA